MVHLLSFIVLVLKINATKSCRGTGSALPLAWITHGDSQTFNAGISLKTQELYTLVFVCRYLDLFTNFISP